MASLWRFVLATRPMKFNKLNFVRHVARTKYPPNWKKKVSVHTGRHVATTYPWDMYPQHFHMCVILWFCPCYMSPLHVPATCRLSVYYTSFCRCKMSVQVDPSCLPTFGSNKGLRCKLPNLVRKLDLLVFAIQKNLRKPENYGIDKASPKINQKCSVNELQSNRY